MALRSRLLVQIPVGLKFAELFMTESSKMVKESGIFEEVRPFITFVLGMHLTGGPGSGKGTQCAKIAEEFGFAHLSAGELLRKQISSGCENGAMILDIIKEGRIVPSDITVNLIRREIELSKSRKILVDGFPRTNENRIAFEQIMGVEPDMVIFFDCSKEEMVKRLLSRNQGRIDDNIMTINKRLEGFDKLNLPVINYYSSKGKLHKLYMDKATCHDLTLTVWELRFGKFQGKYRGKLPIQNKRTKTYN